MFTVWRKINPPFFLWNSFEAVSSRVKETDLAVWSLHFSLPFASLKQKELCFVLIFSRSFQKRILCVYCSKQCMKTILKNVFYELAKKVLDF